MVPSTEAHNVFFFYLTSCPDVPSVPPSAKTAPSDFEVCPRASIPCSPRRNRHSLRCRSAHAREARQPIYRDSAVIARRRTHGRTPCARDDQGAAADAVQCERQWKRHSSRLAAHAQPSGFRRSPPTQLCARTVQPAVHRTSEARSAIK